MVAPFQPVEQPPAVFEQFFFFFLPEVKLAALKPA